MLTSIHFCQVFGSFSRLNLANIALLRGSTPSRGRTGSKSPRKSHSCVMSVTGFFPPPDEFFAMIEPIESLEDIQRRRIFLRRWRSWAHVHFEMGGEVALFLSSAGLGVTIAFLFHETTYSDIQSLSGIVTTLSRVCALVGTYLILMGFLIIARIPWLEHSVGFDKLVALHRKLGPPTVVLILLHVLLVILGYSIVDSRSYISEFWNLITNYDWMLPALIAAIGIVVIGFSSAAQVRRRLRYEVWWTFHLYSYFVVALAFMHQILTGSLFIFQPLAKAWWIALYANTFVAMVLWRFILPVSRSFRHRLVIDRVEIEGPQVISVYIKGRSLKKLRARGGNFFEWRFLAHRIWSQAHPYSLSASPTDNFLRITVKNLGDHSLALASLVPGTRVVAEGPYGTLVAHRATGKKILLIAGGVGITPLRAMIEDFSSESQVDLIYRVERSEELVFVSELDAIAEGGHIHVHYLVGSPEEFPMSPEDLERLIPHIGECDIFVCGPPELERVVHDSVTALGISRAKYHHEAFAFHAG